MKHVVKYLVILLIIAAIPTNLCFATDYSNDKLSWEEFYPEPYEYPDDVGGMYFDSATGKEYYLVINPTPERLEELRTILSGTGNQVGNMYFDPMNLPENIDELRAQYAESINFTTPCKYSFNELMRVNYEIYLLMGPDSSIYGAGLGWDSSDGVLTGFGETGKELRVVVSVNENEVARYTAEFAERFGDMVIVKAGSPGYPTSYSDDMGSSNADADNAIEGNSDKTGLSGIMLWPLIIAGIGLLIALSVIIWLQTRQKAHRSEAEVE